MVVLQSMWIGLNHCWNFMESGSESATYSLKHLPFLLNCLFSCILVDLWMVQSPLNMQEINEIHKQKQNHYLQTKKNTYKHLETKSPKQYTTISSLFPSHRQHDRLPPPSCSSTPAAGGLSSCLLPPWPPAQGGRASLWGRLPTPSQTAQRRVSCTGWIPHFPSPLWPASPAPWPRTEP